jgi:hypothetical protein
MSLQYDARSFRSWETSDGWSLLDAGCTSRIPPIGGEFK